MSNEVIDKEESFPYIPKDLLEALEKQFDIRHMIFYSHDYEGSQALYGMQQVLSFLRNKFEEQLNKEME